MKDHTDLIVRQIVLEQEVEHYKTLLLPHDTGHIHTTINFLQARIQEIEIEREARKL